jgi:phosphopantetheinyl transferase
MKSIELPESWRERALVLEWSEADLSNVGMFFTPTELAAAAAHRLEKRRAEWMLGRMAAKMLASQRGLSRDPRLVVVERPHLEIDGTESEWFVSLSHSGAYAAAAVDKEPVGIDVQSVRDVSETAAHLFLTDEETEQMRTCNIPYRLLHFWCAKEAAWKQLLGEVVTLRRVHLTLNDESVHGLHFDGVETFATATAIIALTL